VNGKKKERRKNGKEDGQEYPERPGMAIGLLPMNMKRRK